MADKYQNYKDLHDQTQKKAFTSFINEKIPNLIENDLYLEVKDGIKLIKLVETLTNTRLKYNKKCKNKAQCIDNVNRLINYLIDNRKIKLVNINAIDIVEHGNHTIILALIWIIILHFFISKIRSLQLKMQKVKVNSLSNDRSSNDSKYSKEKSNLINELSVKLNRPINQNPPNESTSLQKNKSSNIESLKESDLIIDQENKSNNYLINAKQLLIDNLNLKFDLNLKNFNRDWKDGKKILLMIDKFKSNLNLINKGEQFHDDYERLQFALNSAEHHLGIKKLINEDDIYQEKPDCKSLIVYFYQYLEKILDDSIYDDNLIDDKPIDNLIDDKLMDNLIDDKPIDDLIKSDNLNNENVFINEKIEHSNKLIDDKSNEFNKCYQNELSDKSKKISNKQNVDNISNKMNSNNLNEININVQIEFNDIKNSNSNKLNLNQNLDEQINLRNKRSDKINKINQLDRMKSRKKLINKHGYKTGDKLINDNRLNRSKKLLKHIDSIDNTFIFNDIINNQSKNNLIDNKKLNDSKFNQSKTTNKLFAYIDELNNNSKNKFNDAFILDKSIENRSFLNKKFHSESDLIDNKLLDDSKLSQSNTTNKLFAYIDELNNNSKDQLNDAFILDKSIYPLSISNNQINEKITNDKYEIRSFLSTFNEFNNKITNQFYLDNDFNLNDKKFNNQINDQYNEKIVNINNKNINEINFDTFNKIDTIDQINMNKQSINEEIKSNQLKYSQKLIYKLNNNLKLNDNESYVKILIESNLPIFLKLILFFSLFIIIILILLSNLIMKCHLCKC